MREPWLRTGVYRETFFSVYPLVHEPHQLIFLAQCLEELCDVPGAIVEAGCSRGATTVWLKKHADHLGLERPVYALDTFEGFVSEQVDYEVRHRGKDRSLQWVFTENRLRWFEETLRVAGVSGVAPIRCDVAGFDFAALAPIAFCFLDVDLYLPIRAALPRVHAALSPGGLIVIDDCLAGTPYDGALAAYREFVAAEGLPETIVHTKFGLVRRPR